MQINQQDLTELRALLPETFAGVVALIGLEKAFVLVEKYGGTTFPIGKVLWFCMGETLGDECVDKLKTALRGKSEFYVPRCDKVLRELRNRQIRREYDELITQNPPMSVRLAANNLARHYQLSSRQIANIVNEAGFRQPENGCLFA